jgi:hypothetical protein
MTPPTSTPPAWWQALEADFAGFLRTPLRDDGGRFRSGVDAAATILPRVHDDDRVGAARRLALYHEQYWMRLFHVLQQAFPRTSRVLGAFTFNQLASAFLVAHGPRGFDLDDLARGFHPALQATLDVLVSAADRAAAPHGVVSDPVSVRVARVDADRLPVPAWGPLLRRVTRPWSMVAQALSLDEACRRAFEAPASRPWTITDDDIAALMASRARVVIAPSLSIVRVDWTIDVDDLTLPTIGNAAANAAAEDDDDNVDVGFAGPARRMTALHHVVVHHTEGVRHGVVDAVLARILVRLRREDFHALQRHVEEKFPPGAVAHLQHSFAGYARLAAAQGWWIGLSPSREPR